MTICSGQKWCQNELSGKGLLKVATRMLEFSVNYWVVSHSIAVRWFCGAAAISFGYVTEDMSTPCLPGQFQ
jgi:hypothetical protein